MTNERLIEEATLAMVQRYAEPPHAEWLWSDMARAALAVFEKAHTPTDDEREALNTLYWTHPDGHTTGLSADAINAILTAGFRRSGRHDMEYGVTYTDPREPVTITRTFDEAKDSQKFYNRIGKGKYKSLIFERTRGVQPGEWVESDGGEGR